MKALSYSRFIYDLELKSMLQKYESSIVNAKLISADKTPDYFIELLKFAAVTYCNFKKINFDMEPSIIISPNDEGAYYQLLSNSLIFYEKHRIRQYLNYHEKIYLKAFPENSFVDLVEFIIADILMWSSPIDNSKRLDIVLKWVENKREVKVKVSRVREINTDVDLLFWAGEQTQMLTLTSLELSARNYTLKPYDFTKVFKKDPAQITWNKGIASWVYFMSKIRSSEYLSTNRGPTPYLKIGYKFFNFCNEGKKISAFEQKILDNENFSQLLHNMAKRTQKKYAKIKQDVDSMVSSIHDSLVTFKVIDIKL